MLTCAHNCFFRDEKKHITDLKFIPVVHGKNAGREYSVNKAFFS